MTVILSAGTGVPTKAERRPPATLVPTLFHQEWWIEIASKGAFGIAEVRASGQTIGRLPYAIRRHLGFKAGYMPPLTHVLGPAVDEGAGGPATRFLKRLAVTRELIRMLPPTVTFRQKLHREIEDTLAFQAEGFTTSVIFTHEIAPGVVDDHWKNLRDKTRNVIRQAQNRLTVMPMEDVDEFLHFYQGNLTARGRQNRIEPAVSRALIAASQRRGCGRVLAAHGPRGKLEAAIFTAWGNGAAHYLMSSRAPDSSNGAVSLLLWEAVKAASNRGMVFDFSGVAHEGAILFYAGFGARIKPCFTVERSTGAFRTLQTLHRLRPGRFTTFG